MSTERRLMKDKEVAVAYRQVINDYLDKEYIRRVPDDERTPECQWLLPHFPIVRPEKATSKVRIVFDGSAPFEGKSLNTEALTGPKLQRDAFDILVKFRKEGWLSLETSVKCTTSLCYFQKTDRCIVSFGETWRLTRNPKCTSFSASCLAAATAHSVLNLPGRSMQKSTKTRTHWLQVQ